jgi:hypothetical protein
MTASFKEALFIVSKEIMIHAVAISPITLPHLAENC